VDVGFPGQFGADVDSVANRNRIADKEHAGEPGLIGDGSEGRTPLAEVIDLSEDSESKERNAEPHFHILSVGTLTWKIVGVASEKVLVIGQCCSGESAANPSLTFRQRISLSL
jgi:hypothetical protein